MIIQKPFWDLDLTIQIVNVVLSELDEKSGFIYLF